MRQLGTVQTDLVRRERFSSQGFNLGGLGALGALGGGLGAFGGGGFGLGGLGGAIGGAVEEDDGHAVALQRFLQAATAQKRKNFRRFAFDRGLDWGVVENTHAPRRAQFGARILRALGEAIYVH